MKQVNKIAKNIDEGIKYMIDAMVEDYGGFNQHNKIDEVRDNMYNEYKNSFKITNGQKYIKVTNDGSVKAFIVKKDNGKFKTGDILKPASWKAPAKGARGNIFDKYGGHIWRVFEKSRFRVVSADSRLTPFTLLGKSRNFRASSSSKLIT